MTFGQRLAALRKQSRLTQQKLGEQLNVSAQAISKWENDQAEPDVATICRLAKIYNISIDALLMGKDDFEKNVTADNHFIQKVGPSTSQTSKKRLLLFAILVTLACLALTIVLLGIFVFSDSLAIQAPFTHSASSPSSYFQIHFKGDFLS